MISPGAIRDAGMFADSKATRPPLMGTGKPEQVGAAVVSAIERDRGEITVAPMRQRVLSALRGQRARALGPHRGQDGDRRSPTRSPRGQTDKR